MTIPEHKKAIKRIFHSVGVHVTVNHSIDLNCIPEVCFRITIRKKNNRKIKLKDASNLMFNYAHSIEFKK